jgi:hypothetical protein
MERSLGISMLLTSNLAFSADEESEWPNRKDDVFTSAQEIESMGDVTQVALGQENGKVKAEAIRRKCEELMTLIERDHFKRDGST